MAEWREHFMQSFGPGILAGIDLRDWLRLLRENRWAVEPRFWSRANAITINALVTSAYRRREDEILLSKLAKVQVQQPVFVLGHWRTGTTHLHQLLSVDQQFASPNVFQTAFPHTFLTTEARRSKQLGAFLAATRPMDNVKLSFQAPSEDEFAICTTTFQSPYMSWVFPRRADDYDRYLTLSGLTEPEIARWKEALLLFLKKLTIKYDRPLLLKSPPHTCRIGVLLDMFPDARFVHIHRHPAAVFQSTVLTNQALLKLTALQSASPADWSRRAIVRYRTMYDKFFEEKILIPTGQLHELSFEDLERDPVGQVASIYAGLKLEGFAQMEGSLRQYVESLRDYEKNQFADLSPELLSELGREWRRCFDEWGYETKDEG